MCDDFNNTLVGHDESEDEGTSHSPKYAECVGHDESEDEGTSHSQKYAKREDDTTFTTVREQSKLDEQMARELDNQLN